MNKLCPVFIKDLKRLCIEYDKENGVYPESYYEGEAIYGYSIGKTGESDDWLKPDESECPHCKFLADTFDDHINITDREYYLMTEVFVYLHGGDICEYSTPVAPNHRESLD